jgi:hypothetical protein
MTFALATIAIGLANTTSFTGSMLKPFQSRCTIHHGIATRYIGDSNQILQEIIQAGFRILDVELIAPKQPEDLADLWVIAQKRSAADPP